MGLTVVGVSSRYLELGLMHRLSFTHGGPIQADSALQQHPPDWAAFNARWGDFLGANGRGAVLPFGLQDAAVTAVEVPVSQPLNAQLHTLAMKQGTAVGNGQSINLLWHVLLPMGQYMLDHCQVLCTYL